MAEHNILLIPGLVVPGALEENLGVADLVVTEADHAELNGEPSDGS